MTDGFMYDVFIAHLKKDTKSAEQLYKELTGLRLQVFLDTKSIKAGEPWPPILDEAQKKSRITIVLLSKQEERGTEYSFYFDSEIHQGLTLSRSSPPHIVMPIYLDDDPNIPYALNIIEGIKVSDYKGISLVAQYIQELINKISRFKNSYPEGSKIFQGMVIYGELMGFSGMSLEKKVDCSEILSKEISNFSGFAGSIDWLDFRGGEFILFKRWRFDFDSRKKICIDGLIWGLSLHHTLKEEGLDLAIVVDWEDCGRVLNIPSVSGLSEYMFGNAFIRAPSLVGFSNKPHVMISEHVYSILKEWFKMEFMTKLHDIFCSKPSLLGQKGIRKEDKTKIEKLIFHDLDKSKYTSYNFYVLQNGNNKIIFGNNSKPQQKVWIEYRVRSGEENPFVKKLAIADKACIIGVTNENLADLLGEALEIKGKFWDYLQIIFPSKSIIDKIFDQHNEEESINSSIAIQARTKLWNEGRQLVFRFLLAQGNSENWECLMFDGNFAFIGQRFHSIGNDIGISSSIRIAPVLPGINFDKSYYTEVFDGTKMYAILNKSIEKVISNSPPIKEWIIYGRTEEDIFIFQGLKDHRIIHETEGYVIDDRPCLMVVLVMLHCDHYAVLQLRKKNNASDNCDLYSNISGYVSDLDVLEALKITPPPDFYYTLKTADEGKANTLFSSVIKVGDLCQDQKVSGKIIELIAKRAGQRELKEELGVEFEENKLQSLDPPLILKLNDKILFFKIFTLQINEETIGEIKQKRPYSGLEKCDLNKLRRLREKNLLNKLLTENFRDHFLGWYKKLL